MRSIGAALLAAASILLAACGGGGGGGGGGAGGGAGPTPTPTTPTPTPTGIQITAALQAGSYIEFAVNTESTTFAQGSGTSSSNDFGIFRITLGASTTIGGATVFPITVSGDANVGGTNFAPRWTYIGIQNGSVVGSTNGTTLETIYNASALTARSAGFFITFGSTENVTASSQTFTAEYNTLPAVRAAHSSSSGGCETILGLTLCQDSSTTFSENEYYVNGVGPVGYARDSTFSSSGGGFFSSHTNRVRIEVIATSLTPADGSTIRTAPWRELAPMAQARERHSAAVHNGKIYVFGGFGATAATQTSMEIYDPVTNTWSAGATPPSTLTSTVARTVGNLIYVIRSEAASATQICNPANNTWAAPGAAHATYNDPSHDGDVVVRNAAPNAGTYIVIATPDGAATTQMETALYQVSGGTPNTWFTGAVLTTFQRRFAAATAVGADLYVIGGFVPAGLFSSESVSRVTSRFNIDSNSWVNPLAEMRQARLSARAVTLNGEPIILGGTNLNGTQFREVEAYSPSANAWRDLPSMLRPRQHMAAVVLDGKIYVIGGAVSSTAMNNVEVYTPN